MGYLKTRDNISLFYKDWGSGLPIVFSHGWPLSADAWDAQMLFFGERGYRVIAHDRRGHGRSEQTWDGNDMDTYADDLAQLINALDLRNVILIGHSTGGGEVTRYVGRHGTERLGGLVLMSAVPPLMLKSEKNPKGLPREEFDGLRAKTRANRSQFFRELAMPFFGFNRKGAHVSEGIVDEFWREGMLSSIRASYECIRAFSETDFTDDLRAVDVRTLILHGDDDQIVPIAASGEKSAQLVRGSIFRIIRDAPHGMAITEAPRINQELLSFVQSVERSVALEPEMIPPGVH